METVNQSKNIEAYLNSNIKDSPQSINDVESHDSSEIKQSVNEVYNRSKCKATTAQIETETSNIKFPVVEKEDNNNDNHEESMDTRIADDNIDKRRKNTNEVKQVEVSFEPQSQPQYNDREHNCITDDEDEEGGETISNEAKKFKYEEAKTAEEEELLKSDNEDDKNTVLKENVTTDLHIISMEEEEELLKSEDEDQAISKAKERIFNVVTNEDTEDTSEKPKIKEQTPNCTFEITTQDIKQMAEKTNESNFNLLIHNDVKIENATSIKHDLKEQNKIKNCDNSFHQIKDDQHKSENFVEEHCSNNIKSPERVLQTRIKKYSEHHRILYQFDLDDDSSSQNSFEFNKSPSAVEPDDKISNTLDDSSSSKTQVYETTPGSIKDINKGCRENFEKDSPTKAEIKAEIPYSPSSKVPLSDSDGAVSDNETDTPYSLSTRRTSVKDGEGSCDNEVENPKNIQLLSPPNEASLKSRRSSFDEDDCMHQDVVDVADTRECSRKISDSSNLTANNLHLINANDFYEENYQNETLTNDKISVDNEMDVNDGNTNKVNNKTDEFPVTQNGNANSENGYDETENCNDSCLRDDEESKISNSQETSLDSNCRLSSPQQQSSFNLPENEESQTSIYKEENDNINKLEDESNNESNLKMSENIHDNEYNDTDANKQGFRLLSPLKIRNEEEEASRSSLASSSSYSSSTSSSQHLVIDHPMEDVKPLRITLKRKLSYLSDDENLMGPKQKQVHLHDETLKQENHCNPFLLREKNNEGVTKISGEVVQNEEDIEMAEYAVQNYQAHQIEDLDNQNNSLILDNKEKVPLFSTELDLAESSFFKSLLLQQLKRPLEKPNTVTNCNVSPHVTTAKSFAPIHPTPTPLPTKSAESSSILVIPPPPPPPKLIDTSATKYLCFKCKTGSFDSLAALTEHQATCLIPHNLFPLISSQTPRTSITSPINSFTSTNSLPSSKPTTLTEFKETVAHTNSPAVPTIKKRYYKCCSCNTFHENWNLFLHIREQHNRHMCLYCVRFFPTAEKLALHLEIKHDLEQNHFNSEEALRNSTPVLEGYPLESRFLMCCTCQHIFMENEQFSQHDCSEFIKPCSLCGQKGRHTNQCKAHPDSKRFSKLKKKKEKHTQQAELLLLPATTCNSDRSQVNITVPPKAISNQSYNPTIISNSNFNCDSGRAVKYQQPQTFNSMHSEDSSSSNNMVIDESCNISHIQPVQAQPEVNVNANESLGLQTQKTSVRIEPDLPPDRLPVEDEMKTLSNLKLVVPKFKLRVPKEFQKSVDDALSTTSDSGEDIDDDQDEQEKKDDTEAGSTQVDNTTLETCTSKDLAVEAVQNSLLAESTPANSQDVEIERNSATEAGNSQDNIANKSVCNNNNLLNPALLLDDDDSLDEPNSNLVRIMQEIERTKLDIQRTKKTSIRHNKAFALPRQPAVSQSSNKTTDHNWSPTPPASPNSRWFTPRRSTISQGSDEQLKKMSQNQQVLLVPPSPIKQFTTTKGRRDTIGSDMMDIDDTLTSQPTQTIYCNKLHTLDNEDFNNSNESIDEKSCNETSVSGVNNSLAENENWNKQPSSLLIDSSYSKNKNNFETDDTPPKQTSPGAPDNMDVALTEFTDNKNNQQTETRQCQEDEAEDDTEIDVCDKEQEHTQLSESEKLLEVENLPSADGIEIANDETIIVDMKLDKPLDKYEIIDFVRVCLKAVYPLCLYCNHARRIAVNGKNLVLHMIGNHRFTATVDSITAEELLPATIVAKLKSFLVELEDHFFNSNSYCTYGEGAFVNHFNERIFECFQCRFVTSTHKELYLHNRKMHLRTAILCFMCRSNFFSFSEILCHICPGVPNKVSVFDVKFRCCLCDLDNIPSPFRLMVHLRKKHFACDVCLEDCRDQSKLSSHVWKHKLHHLCYRCGIAYRNKLDITKHLFWKHGTESTICKRCLQKRWRHVYHFCIPPTTFVCEVCNLCFSKAMYLRVHKRLHSGDLRYPCIEDSCEEKFISRKLLLKHAVVHQVLSAEALQENVKDPEILENKENELTMTDDVIGGNPKTQSDLQNIKKELMDIKMEPLDDSEMESQMRSTEKNSELAEKKEPDAEQINSTGLKSFTDEKIKEKKHLGRKRKKSKRSKELLEDLNLTAPNLSESDSSDDSDTDSDSKTRSEIDALPRVILSPPSETENEDKENKSLEVVEPAQVLEIWKNFLNTQQDSNTVKELERLKATNEENKQPKHVPIHVACSDHDYCKIEVPENSTTFAASEQVKGSKTAFKKPMAEATSTPEISPTKRKQSKSPRRICSKRSDASSSSSGSSSSSDSSCSCGSNCSCSSSESNSSSSSSSSEESDSSLASNNSIRKRHRKRSERDRMRKRSESMSPLKQHKLSVSISEVIDVGDEDIAKESDNIHERPISPKEPLIYESDLETNESETDEEFYDEHPQKLANELLAQKRAQLMAQTRLSPSHNYDIVENSRPSTPSLPEEVATNEKPKIKVKKKKRDRKSSCKGLHTSHVTTEQANAPAQSVLEIHQPSNSLLQPSPNAAFVSSVIDSHHTKAIDLYHMPHNSTSQTGYALPQPAVLTEQSTLTPRPLTMPPYGNLHRISDGSSCSDADGSLKRSKRQRRPNKFYGYTSDDENLINGPPLMIGTRAFKPQPPPQLTWRKEDLPTPSKSILHSKNKTPRTPKTPATFGITYTSALTAPSSKKKSRLSLTGGEKSARKRSAKKRDDKMENKFPPIPTLKIRPSEIGLNTTINHDITKSSNYNTTDDTSSDDETTKEHFPTSNNFSSSAVNQSVAVTATPIVLPSQPPPPPTPQTKAFNHRIPPALLPNPDFATLQYFKANNIRYPIRPPAGARQPREGESVYCYCRCPYDEVSEMIACDGENCLIEWFHFECVGIMVAPQGKWFCAECRPKYSEELYPSSAAGQLANV